MTFTTLNDPRNQPLRSLLLLTNSCHAYIGVIREVATIRKTLLEFLPIVFS